MLAPWKKSYDQPRQHIKNQRHHFANKGPYSQSYGFSSSHVWIWELDHKEGWELKNWCFQTVVLERVLRVSWTARRSSFKEILKKINTEYSFKDRGWSASTLATWCEELTRWKRLCYWESLRAGEGDKRRWDGWMASLTQWTEFEQGDSGGQKSLVYFSPWDHKRLDVTWWLNSNNKLHPYPWLTVINIARYIQKFIQPLWRTVWRFLKKTKNRFTIWLSNLTNWLREP